MTDSLAIFGWVALGFCVSIVAMILPFRRGAAGIAINMVSAIAGALLGGFVGHALGFYDKLGGAGGFGMAAAASIALTLLVHAVVMRRSRRATESPAE